MTSPMRNVEGALLYCPICKRTYGKAHGSCPMCEAEAEVLKLEAQSQGAGKVMPIHDADTFAQFMMKKKLDAIRYDCKKCNKMHRLGTTIGMKHAQKHMGFLFKSKLPEAETLAYIFGAKAGIFEKTPYGWKPLPEHEAVKKIKAMKTKKTNPPAPYLRELRAVMPS